MPANYEVRDPIGGCEDMKMQHRCHGVLRLTLRDSVLTLRDSAKKNNTEFRRVNTEFHGVSSPGSVGLRETKKIPRISAEFRGSKPLCETS